MAGIWKTVRVFISSTFRDMHAERDHLVKVVFPALRERLEKHLKPPAGDCLFLRIWWIEDKRRGPRLEEFGRQTAEWFGSSLRVAVMFG